MFLSKKNNYNKENRTANSFFVLGKNSLQDFDEVTDE